MKKYFIKNNQKGFTLIEMMISLALFSIVAIVAIGSLLRVMDANRKSINLKTAINNMNFAFESLSREMRVGKKYYCDSNVMSAITRTDLDNAHTCNNSQNTFHDIWKVAFESTKKNGLGVGACNLIYAYRFYSINNVTHFQKAQQTACNESINDDDYLDVIPPDLVKNASITMNTIPAQHAIFFFTGSTQSKDKDKVEFSIQTRVTQRLQE